MRDVGVRRDSGCAIEDVACAVRYLRASAKKLKIDGNRMGAMGQSAGAQLVSLLGTSDRSAGFDVGQYLKQSRRFSAALHAPGVSRRLVVVAHAGHRLVPVGAAPKPTAAQVQTNVVAFFAEHLQP